MIRLYSILLGVLFLTACGGGVEGEESLVEEKDTLKTEAATVEIDSLQFFNDQIKANPNSTDWWYRRGVYNLGQGNIENSRADLLTAMELDSSNLDARLIYGNILLSVTDLDSSKYHYDYILQRDSSNTGALIGMSKLYALLDNSAMADKYISAALKVDPYMAEAYFMRGIVYRSDFYKRGKQESWDRALSSFQTAVEQDPNYYSAYVEMGVMYDQIGSKLALEYYQSAIDIEPESAEVWYNVGMYHQTRGNYEPAMKAYRTINDIDSTWADPYYNQGYIHLVKIGHPDSAVIYFTKAVEIDPEYYQAFNNLGLAYETLGDMENAKKYYQKAVEVNPEFQLAKDNLNSLR